MRLMSLFLVGTGVIATPPDGAEWVPPECDVSIRPGWFYRASEDKRVTDLAALSGMRERLDRVYGRDLAAGGTVVTAGRTTTLRLPARRNRVNRGLQADPAGPAYHRPQRARHRP